MNKEKCNSQFKILTRSYLLQMKWYRQTHGTTKQLRFLYALDIIINCATEHLHSWGYRNSFISHSRKKKCSGASMTAQPSAEPILSNFGKDTTIRFVLTGRWFPKKVPTHSPPKRSTSMVLRL